MNVMYCRVSSKDQNLDIQKEAGQKAGVDLYFEEKVSGKNTIDRPEFRRMLEYVREGDVVIVYKLDRLARSTLDLLETIKHLDNKGVGFKSLTETWADTTTPAGKLMITIFAGLAEFQRELIAELRTAGIAARRAKGLHMGRRPKLDESQREALLNLYQSGTPIDQLTEIFKASRATIGRILAQHRKEI